MSHRFRLWSGLSMITSCAPIPRIRSYSPTPLRPGSPSIIKAGYLLGTTRTVQPGVFGDVPSRNAMISGGVFDSLPEQNGQLSEEGISVGERLKSIGLRLRSVAMITHRREIGSCRSSDILLAAPLRSGGP